MKMMKLALLGGAALAVTAVGAQADDLSALKAEIEALNARVAQLEASPALPTGYSLMTMTEAPMTVVPGNTQEDKGLGPTASVIGVLPTADAPAATTIEWSGYVYAIVANTDYSYWGGNRDTNILGRAHLRVVGQTDTAVGQVGVRVQLRSQWSGVDGDLAFFGHEYWGWWAMTPELTLGGGYSGSLGNLAYGMDGTCNCWWTDWFSNDFRTSNDVYPLNAANPGDATQVRLTYASGPMSAAIALEEGDTISAFGAGDLAVAGEIAYHGDTFSGEISGIAWQGDDQGGNIAGAYGNGWQVGAGIGFALGDMANLSLAAAVGQDSWDGDYWNVSGNMSFNLTEAVHAEIGAAYGAYTEAANIAGQAGKIDLTTVQAGIYYDPVAQLTLGLEAQWSDADWFLDDFTTFDFVSIYRF